MTTLRELVEEFGANGVIRIDAGNGSAGPAWIEWTEEDAEELGDTEMTLVAGDARAYEDDSGHQDTVAEVAKHIIAGYSSDELYVSEWIEDDDRGGEYQAVNPYRYRLVF